MDPITRLVHVIALVVYGGATVALVAMLLPMAAAAGSPAEERRLLSRGLTPYNVVSVGALGVLIMSGATALTGLKASFGAAYTALLWPLVGKLGLTFLLTMVGTYLSFGIAHRLVRAERLGDPVDEARQRSMLARLRGGAWLALALTLWTTWVGLQLADRAARIGSATAATASP